MKQYPILNPVKIAVESQYQRILDSDNENRVKIRKKFFGHQMGELGEEYYKKIEKLDKENPERYSYLLKDQDSRYIGGDIRKNLVVK